MEPEIEESPVHMPRTTNFEEEERSSELIQKLKKGKKNSTQVDNQKNYGLNAVKALKREVETNEVAFRLLEQECLKRDVSVKTVK